MEPSHEIVNQTSQFLGYKFMLRVATQMTGNLRNRFKENLAMLIVILLISLMTIFGS
jgi:hypothetical protein